MASALGLFVSNLLSVSRLPKAMADDGYLPHLLRSVSRGRGTPYVSIVACAVIVSAMVLWHFEDLLIIDVGLYSCALFLEFFALVRLRKTRPEMKRPFRIPLSGGGLVVLSALPVLCFLAGIAGFAAGGGIHTGALLFTLLSLGTAPVAWLFASRRRTPAGT
jgi:amino acid transporter